MNQQDIFASAQVVTRHPVLAETEEQKYQYYAYLKSLIQFSKWNRRKYVKAQLAFYQNILCGDTGKGKVKDRKAISPYIYLLPFDIVAIVAYRNSIITSNVMAALIDQIVSQFNLPHQARNLLELEFLAALGDKQAWKTILRNSSLKRYTKYLYLVKDNIFFLRERPYSILITATMSAGKSTLINTLVGKNISLMQNMVATSKIHVIISKLFDDNVTMEQDSELSLNATKDELLTDNENNRSTRISVSTYFQGLLGGQRVILYDSPGVNSSQNTEHTQMTRRILNSKKYNLLLYVLNATQLGTTDEEQHLNFVAKAIRTRKLLFIMNKIDHLFSEEESILDIIARQRDFLKKHGFETPIVCPISARAAYLTKKSMQESLSRLEQREMESYMDKFAQGILPEYYEKQMGCPTIPLTGDEVEDLYRNCGFAYMEKIIVQYKEEK